MDGAVSDTDPEHCPAIGVFIQGSETVGEHRRMPGNYVGDAGRQFHTSGAVGKQGQRHEGITENGLGIGHPDPLEPNGLGAGDPIDKILQGAVWENTYVE